MKVSDTGAGAQRFGFVCFFPGKAFFVATEMSVSRCGFVDRPAQVQVLDNSSRGKFEVVAYQLRQRSFADASGTGGVDQHGNRIGDADGIRKLDQTTIGKSGGDDIFRNIAGHVSSGAIDLRRILSGESATTVGGVTAIRVDDDLS